MGHKMFLHFEQTSNTTTFALKAAITLLVGLLFGLAFKENLFWLLVTLIFISNTTLGTPFKQVFNFFILAVFILLLAYLLRTFFNDLVLIYLTLAVILIGFVLAKIIFLPLTNKTFYSIIFFPAFLLLASLAPLKLENFIYDGFIAIGTGAIIALSASILFPINLAQEFRLGLVPALTALIDFSKCLADTLSLPVEQKIQLIKNKFALEKVLQTIPYPEWAFETGFNPGLRSGFRFFLIHLERVIELYFSLQALVGQQIEKGLLEKIQEPIKLVMKNNEVLLKHLIDYFAAKKIHSSSADFSSDLSGLEKILKENVPGSLELLEISPDYVTLTDLVMCVRDIRLLLLELLTALPKPI